MNSIHPASLPASSSEDVALPPPPSYYLRSGDLLAVAVLCGIFALLSVMRVWHTDIWAHLKFGEWIVQHRALPAQEPFSPFAEQQPYIHFQWLMQAGLYVVFAAGEGLAGGDELHRLAGGVDMLASAFLLLFMLRYLILFLAYRRLTGSAALASVGVLLTFAFLSHTQRPQVAGDFFFACLLLALSRPVLSRRALVLIPLCLVLWANMHGSYLVGLALLGIFFLGRILEVGRERGSWRFGALSQDAQLRRLLLAGFLSALCIAVLNPHGPYLYLYTLQLSRHPNIPTMDEWLPLSFRWGPGGHWGYAALLLNVLISMALSPRTLSPTRVLLCLSFGVFPLLQQRMMTWWIVLVPWIVLPMWAAFGKRMSESSAPPPGQASLAKTVLAGFLILVALALSPPVQWLRARGPRPLDRSLSPGTPWRLAAQLKAPPGEESMLLPDLAAALQRDYPNGRFQGCIFTSEAQGDYLLWALPPEYPVLVYTHAHLFSAEHWTNCMLAKRAVDGWRNFLDLSNVNLVVSEAEEHYKLTRALKADPEWQIILDETGLQSKRDPRTRLLIAVRKKPRLP